MPSIAESRDTWKKKAIERRMSLKSKDKSLARLRLARSVDRDRISYLEEKLERLENQSISHKALIVKESAVRVMVVLLVIQARISFRSIPRVLSTIDFRGRIPHYSSAINWASRVGLSMMQSAKTTTEPWVAVMDMTIDIGRKKALVVLRLPLAVYLNRDQAVTLKDVSFVGIEIRESWKGEDVAKALSSIIGEGVGLKAILKDGGTDLDRGVRIWKGSASMPHVKTISDVGHEAANALKADFAKLKSFKELSLRLRDTATGIYYSRLAFLAPPKLRVKGRFMGISKLGDWLLKIERLLGGAGRAPKDSIAADLREVFGGLGNLSYIARQLSERSLKIAEVLKILKTRGLNQETYREAIRIIDTLPRKSQCHRRLTRWLRKHLQIQARLAIGQTPLPVSSDIIESLFGTFKNLLARSSNAELNQLVLVMPALCGKLDEREIADHLSRVSHKQVVDWKEKNIPRSARSLRREIMSECVENNANSEMGRQRCGNG